MQMQVHELMKVTNGSLKNITNEESLSHSPYLMFLPQGTHFRKLLNIPTRIVPFPTSCWGLVVNSNLAVMHQAPCISTSLLKFLVYISSEGLISASIITCVISNDLIRTLSLSLKNYIIMHEINLNYFR